jgi:AcrR family transcriptional regulator
VAQILDATAAIVAANGPGAATIGAIGNMLKAPSGSIYHRFASRDVLLGRLWLSKAAFFQNRFAAPFRGPRSCQGRTCGGALDAARGTRRFRRRAHHAAAPAR